MNYSGQAGTSNAPSNSSDQNRKLFLGGLNYHTTDETLKKFCSRFGNFTDCLVMRTPEGKSRGFGFVTYENEDSVEEFMRARPHTIDSRQIDPKRAMPREDQNSSEAHLSVKKLFVAGLRDNVDEDNLRDYFSRFGNVLEVLLMKERDGKPRGFGFVSFDDYDAVDKAILNKPHTINGRNLDIKKAIPKEKMEEMGYAGTRPPNESRRGGHGHRRDNYPPHPPPPRDDPYSPNQWDDQGVSGRMGNVNPSYNHPPMPGYSNQGYNSNVPHYNQSMPSGPTGSYPSSYSTNMGQNHGQPMINYDSYNQPPPPPPPPSSSSSSIPPYNNSSNSMNNSNYPGNTQVPPYGSNPSSSYNSMNNPFNAPPVPPPSSNGYNDGLVSQSSYGNPSSYGVNSQNYGGNNNSPNYNTMPSHGRGGGPMRGGRSSTGFNGNNGMSSYGQRSAPYPNRGGRGSGRGRGRGQ